MEQPAATVAFGAVIAVFVTTQLHPPSLVIVEPTNVASAAKSIVVRKEDICCSCRDV